jgi:carbamoyl-phosphate synthase large subunit
MPRRPDLHRILVIGSGPIVIGQAAEFDYSGTQAIKALREEGYEVVLVNSNPATIMTDPGVRGSDVHRAGHARVRREGDRAREARRGAADDGRADGAQRRAGARRRTGVLEKHGVELIGANARAIRVAEDRRAVRRGHGADRAQVSAGRHRDLVRRGARIVEETGYPSIIRPSFTLGGTGGGVAYNREEFENDRAPRARRSRRCRCSWSARSWGGRSTSSRSCATTPTTS